MNYMGHLIDATQDYLVFQYCIARYGRQWRWYYMHYLHTKELLL